MERRTNLEIVQQARGRVLIAGLGIGMILRAILRKPEVTHVTVLEKYKDVIDLVFPSLLRMLAQWPPAEQPPRLEVFHADVFEWTPPPDRPRYHVIYFDIWPNSTIDSLPEMHALHKRYRPLLAKGGWMDSWTYRKLKGKKAEDVRFDKELPARLERWWAENGPEKFLAGMRKLYAAAEREPGILTPANRETIRRFLEAKRIALSS